MAVFFFRCDSFLKQSQFLTSGYAALIHEIFFFSTHGYAIYVRIFPCKTFFVLFITPRTSTPKPSAGIFYLRSFSDYLRSRSSKSFSNIPVLLHSTGFTLSLPSAVSSPAVPVTITETLLPSPALQTCATIR